MSIEGIYLNHQCLVLSILRLKFEKEEIFIEKDVSDRLLETR
jgi:hypothetical protein